MRYVGTIAGYPSVHFAGHYEMPGVNYTKVVDLS